MNKVIMMGRIASDLELRTTPNGISVCTFRLAVDRKYQNKDGEKVTDFFNITTWRNTAEFVSRWFAKGRLILIEGELQTRQYTDKNGNPATWTEIVVEQAHFTGEKSNNTAPQTYTQTPPQQTVNQQPAPQASAVAAPPEFEDDGYPF